MPWRTSLFNLFSVGGKVPEKWRPLALIAGIVVVGAMVVLFFSMAWKGEINEWSFAGIALFLLGALAMVRSGGQDDDPR